MVLPYLKGLLYIFGVIVCDCLWFYYSKGFYYICKLKGITMFNKKLNATGKVKK